MNDDNDKRKTRKRISAYWIYALIFAALAIPLFLNIRSGPQSITWQQFEKNILRPGAVERLEVINLQTVEVYVKSDFARDSFFREAMKPVYGSQPGPGPHFLFTIGSADSFERRLEEACRQYGLAEPEIRYLNRRNWLMDVITWVFPFVLIFLLWRFMTGKAGKSGSSMSPFNFGRSSAVLFEKSDKSPVTFNDVAGLEEAKVEVKEVVDFLRNPEQYTKLGAKIPKGMIIVGPPGTGKTLLARAVAGEAQVSFFSISGSEFVEMFVGVGASRVRDLFRRAKEKAPCIVFIDEIDAVGRSRSRNAIYSGANDERESTLNQLLTEMDGFASNSGVIVLAATNRADMLDPALLRPGRFDRHIYLELPSLADRKAIFGVHMRPLKLDSSVDVAFLASQTPGFSGADIANICNEAALIAARRKKEAIGSAEFMDAIDRIVAGLEKKSKIISDDEKQTIAIHEAGHAIASWYLPGVDPISKISIIPRGKTLGASWYLPEERQLHTRSEMFDRLCATLGGRAAEEILCHEISSGALDDLEKVTLNAYAMVAYYGFNKNIGQVSFFDSTGQRDSFQKPYSEHTGRLIDEEVRSLVATAYERTVALLNDHKDQLVALAALLKTREVVYSRDLEEMLGPRPAPATRVTDRSEAGEKLPA